MLNTQDISYELGYSRSRCINESNDIARYPRHRSSFASILGEKKKDNRDYSETEREKYEEIFALTFNPFDTRHPQVHQSPPFQPPRHRLSSSIVHSATPFHGIYARTVCRTPWKWPLERKNFIEPCCRPLKMTSA